MTLPPEQSEALLALAERVEAASGPDRELDALIYQLVELPLCVEPDCLPDVLRKCIVQTLDGSWPHDTESVPAYTASLDAAMTMVPDNPYNTGERFQVEHWTTNGVHAAHVRASAWVSGARRVFAATPALALTAASLRARAISESE